MRLRHGKGALKAGVAPPLQVTYVVIPPLIGEGHFQLRLWSARRAHAPNGTVCSRSEREGSASSALVSDSALITSFKRCMSNNSCLFQYLIVSSFIVWRCVTLIPNLNFSREDSLFCLLLFFDWQDAARIHIVVVNFAVFLSSGSGGQSGVPLVTFL